MTPFERLKIALAAHGLILVKRKKNESYFVYHNGAVVFRADTLKEIRDRWQKPKGWRSLTFTEIVMSAQRLEDIRIGIALLVGKQEADAAWARAEVQLKSSPFSFLQLLERKRTLIFNRLNA